MCVSLPIKKRNDAVKTSDPRTSRAALQESQASHRPIADHAENVIAAVSRARRPDLIAHLLGRAAAAIRPTETTETSEAPHARRT